MTVSSQVERTFREQHGRVLAALISQLRDIELAEDALQDALVNALERWEIDGVPRNPGAWLLTAARRSSSTTWVEARRRRSSMTTASRISG